MSARKAEAATAVNGGASATLPPWPADKVERWPIGRLLAYARNARIHSADQVDQIARAITEFGWTTPALVDEGGTLIAGHGRIQAAEKLGLKEVPVMVARGWTEDQKRAYRIWDNQSVILGQWDERHLRVELSELAAGGYDLDRLGFNEAQLMAYTMDVITDPSAEWGNMPEYQSQDKSAFRSVLVHFKDQAAVDSFAALIGQRFTPKTKFTWYPEFVVEEAHDKRYEDATASAPAPRQELPL